MFPELHKAELGYILGNDVVPSHCKDIVVDLSGVLSV